MTSCSACSVRMRTCRRSRRGSFATRILERYGLGRVPPGRRASARLDRERLSYRGRPLDALARKIEADAAGLRADRRSVTTASRETGIDDDFGKGATDLHRYNGDPATRPIHASGGSRRRRSMRWRSIRARSAAASAWHRRRCARADRGRRNRRPVRLRQRHGLSHARPLSRPGHHVGSGHGFRLSRGDGNARKPDGSQPAACCLPC